MGLALAIHARLHGVGDEGKKGSLGVGDGAKEWVSKYIVLFSFRMHKR